MVVDFFGSLTYFTGCFFSSKNSSSGQCTL